MQEDGGGGRDRGVAGNAGNAGAGDMREAADDRDVAGRRERDERHEWSLLSRPLYIPVYFPFINTPNNLESSSRKRAATQKGFASRVNPDSQYPAKITANPSLLDFGSMIGTEGININRTIISSVAST
ncbi:hypothetical protein TrVFT333_008775 [Trichoderma virens FT-333]|nr:hypothetical protein TrVFT333_008775 [Trichoderma virens FT-333]